MKWNFRGFSCIEIERCGQKYLKMHAHWFCKSILATHLSLVAIQTNTHTHSATVAVRHESLASFRQEPRIDKITFYFPHYVTTIRHVCRWNPWKGGKNQMFGNNANNSNKRSLIQHVNRMPRNRLPRAMKYYSPTDRRNHGRPFERLLDMWDRNGSTSSPNPWQMFDDDDDGDDDDANKSKFHSLRN